MKYDVDEISKKITSKKRMEKLFKYIILSILIVFFLINLILSFEENAHIFGIYMFNIISESMEPNINVNDVVIVKKYSYEQLKIGDIITYIQDEKIISHRIVNIISEKDEVKFETKGDNNEVIDSEKVLPNQIFGKVVIKIGKVGRIVNYIQNTRILLNIVFFIIIIYILVSLRDTQKNNRKIKRKKYEIKKIRDNYHL